ncbi:CHAD domain-containing protein [Kitasatospora sp. GP30]|uniref:CYTH and CHAD domain-containing protein n=1 Tax=Kitasatospora sp. GP30 TaxID=3035084 RepID=UPI000CB54EC0|nr:CHAD domain-containing protein [Kitasatospora sp. GP30]MDH6141844.1 CHAD domain-containing protein [Kitasatospora sp. GP30]
MGTVAAVRLRTYQGLPSEPVRPRGLPRVAEVVPAGTAESVRLCWDTTDLRLLAHGGALERRQGAAGGAWQLTLPDGTELSGTGATVPAELHDRIRSYTGGRPLHPVLRISSHRARSLLRDHHGRTLAELDRTEVVAQPLGGPPGPGRLAGWTRTEVRLLRSRPRLLAALDGRLRADGLTEVPATVPQAVLVHPATLSAPAPGSAGAALAAYLRRQCAQLLALDGAVRRDEADSVHQMRVCARRLRSSLTSCRSLLRQTGAADIAVELRWLGQVLGAARDAETTGQRLAAAAEQLPPELALDNPAAGLAERFRQRYAAAHQEVREVLDSERYFTLLAAVEQLAADPPLRRRAGRGRTELECLLRREQRRTGHRLNRALALDEGPTRDEALHAARKAAKRARYTAELAGAKPLARRMRTIQETLGSYQDAVVAEHLLPTLAAEAHAAGANSFSYGLLHAAQRPLARSALAAARPAWQRARKTKLCRLR